MGRSTKKSKSYKEYVLEARKKAKKNCICKHKVYICSSCGRIHGSEVDKGFKGLVGQGESE